MGIPGLWPYIYDKFPYAIQHFNPNETNNLPISTVDYLYLDANGLLHTAAQYIENYGGETKRLTNTFNHLPKKERERMIFELFFEKILEVVKSVTPTKVLYIAIDGPAPRAKQQQQRERRYKAVEKQMKAMKEANLEGKEWLPDIDTFNSSSITPGTDFMHELSKYMFWKIRKVINDSSSDSYWRKIKVIYSPPTVPGEGEHKCMDYIRSLPKQERDKAIHGVFGPDGDLIMLCLAIHVKNIFLLREDTGTTEPKYSKGRSDKVKDTDYEHIGYYYLVDMGMVRYNLAKHLNLVELLKTKKITPDTVSNEFVLLGFFIGNDFLPKLKMLYKVNTGLELIIKDYVSRQSNTPLTASKLTESPSNFSRINLEEFGKFIKALSLHEIESLNAQADTSQEIIREGPPVQQSSKFHKVDRTLFVDKTLVKNSVIDNHTQRSTVKYSQYRIAYYVKAGIPFDDNFELKIMEMCKDYLRMIIWVYLYYTKTRPSWNDAYKWNYAPFVQDLSNYLNDNTHVSINHLYLELCGFEPSSPALPFEQLLSILPPPSAYLLPDEYSTLLMSPTSVLVQKGYCPLSFNVDYEGKTAEHMGVILLPSVDYSVVTQAYNEVFNQSEWKYYKNEFGSEWIFKRNNTETDTVRFESEYGIISRCNVNVEKLENNIISSSTRK